LLDFKNVLSISPVFLICSSENVIKLFVFINDGEAKEAVLVH